MGEEAVFAAEVERRGDGTVVVRASGELDLSSAPDLEAVLARVPDGATELVLDLGELTFIDSTGVHVVIDAFEERRRSGSGFTIAGAHGHVLRTFELVGLAHRIPFR